MGTSWVGALGLTALGVLIVAAGTRLFGVLGPREIDLLRRTGVPGARLIEATMAPRSARTRS